MWRCDIKVEQRRFSLLWTSALIREVSSVTLTSLSISTTRVTRNSHLHFSSPDGPSSPRQQKLGGRFVVRVNWVSASLWFVKRQKAQRLTVEVMVQLCLTHSPKNKRQNQHPREVIVQRTRGGRSKIHWKATWDDSTNATGDWGNKYQT